MSKRGRTLWSAAAVIALTVSGLAAVQSVGYWLLSAARGRPTGVLFVDHAGPAVTAGLIAVVTLGIGLAALSARRGRDRSA